MFWRNDATGQRAQDRRLVKKLLAGDERAFQDFVDFYFPKLYRYAYQRLRHHHQVEEVVQEVLIKAARRIETFRGEATLLTWLLQICRHEIARSLSDCAHDTEWMAPFLNDDILCAVVESIEAASSDTPQARYHREELIGLIQCVLDQLPKHYANALEMKYVEGASSTEIAARMGITDSAVDSLLARARAAFRELSTSTLFAFLGNRELNSERGASGD